MLLLVILLIGAKGDSITDNAEAIQEAIDDCNKSGGGRVIIPGDGVYMTGPITVASYVDLHLEANAKLLANPDEKVYNKSAFVRSSACLVSYLLGDSIFVMQRILH